MERKGCHEGCDTKVEHHEWPITMSVSIERIISQLISVRLIMGVWLVNNQVSVGIWRENVLVTIERETINGNETYWNMLKPFS
jgi:hypothetical protein